jgi:hypothetical protein
MRGDRCRVQYGVVIGSDAIDVAEHYSHIIISVHSLMLVIQTCSMAYLVSRNTQLTDTERER